MLHRAAGNGAVSRIVGGPRSVPPSAGGTGARASGPGTPVVQRAISGAVLELVRLGRDGVPVERWAPEAFPGAAHGLTPTPPGWTAEVAVLPETGLAPGEWLQVWLRGPVRTPAGVTRTARWFVAVPG